MVMGTPQTIPVEKYIFLLACLLCGIPIWLPHFPPMVDLPQHAAQVAMLLNLGKPEFPFSELFHLNLFTPYLLGYGLIAAFTPMLGIVAACKLVIWLALAAFAISTRFLLREVGADPYWAWLTFPVLYGFTYQWGLLIFLIAAPIGLMFLAVVWRMKAQPDLRSSLAILLMLIALFFCHALILGFFSMIALAYWMFSVRRIKDFIKCAWPMAAIVPLIIIWFAQGSTHQLTNIPTGWDLSWFRTDDDYYFRIATWADQVSPGWGRINGFIPRLLGERPQLSLTFFGIFLLALPFISGGRISKSRVRLIPVIAVTFILLLLPTYLFRTMYTSQRFTYLFIPLYLIMIDTPVTTGMVAVRAQRYLRLFAPAIAFGWIGYMSIQALQFNRDMDGFDTILTKMEPGKRSLSFVFTRDDSHSIAPVLLYIPSWYSALKSGVTDPSFATSAQLPVIYKPEHVPKAKPDGFVWNPQWFNWQKLDGSKYDYFIARAPVDMGVNLFSTAPCRVELAAEAGQWWLYRKDPNCLAEPAL
jgi:hypothetical protein